jgi:hypothetical protein
MLRCGYMRCFATLGLAFSEVESVGRVELRAPSLDNHATGCLEPPFAHDSRIGVLLLSRLCNTKPNTQTPSVTKMARTRATITVDGPSQKPIVQTAPPLRRSMRSTRASQPIHDDASDEDESEAVPEKPANRKKKLPNQSQEVTPEESPPAARYHTRSKQVKPSEFSDHLASEDHEDIMELPTWPRYKDDLPNAFNGEVDPSLDFISKAPVEIIDSILSFLILDHDPERGVKMKEGNYKPRPHVLISMSAMSRLFYHATEGFARKFLVKNKEALSAPYISSYYRSHPEQYQAYLEHQDTWKKAREEKISKLRRSPRISSQPQPVSAETSRGELWRTFQSRCALCLEHADTRGKFANTVKVCSTCDQAINGMSSVRQLLSRGLAFDR